MAHTPGPWYVGAMTDQLYIINEPPRPAPKDYENTTLKTIAIAKTFQVDGGFAAEEANARLIAAAPDLLEELKELVELFSGYQGMELKRAKAALARAQGEEQ